ncbi:hypothetical protein L484_020990 [Morus notabilis]|uniref:Uncharacterized protein n=1 Tax=Morus notabilis TaxID=981085 RepID=W9QQW6_9ROSA|nr:hypothetical protein L484_020990 [Morus notabilis]
MTFINFDAAFCNGKAGLAVVVVEFDGSIQRIHTCTSLACSSLDAELQAAGLAVQIAASLTGPVRLFGDCKVSSSVLRIYYEPTFEVMMMTVSIKMDSRFQWLQSFQVEDIKQDYETGKDGTTMVTFKADFDCVEKLEDAIKANCSRDFVFFKR